MDAFNNELKKKIFTREKMDHVEKVYKSLNCESFKDYHLTYLKTDVILLADVFENFRKVCLNYYNLDPANYLTLPGLAWDAALLQSNIKLELIDDLEILDMVERGKRGGLCFVGSKRHVKANNKYLDNYDPSKPSNYLMYWDANNLYGWAMIQPLPHKDLKFRNDITIEQILKTPDDSEEGYMVECDLNIPDHLHDKLKEYPPCPENMAPDASMFSDFQMKLARDLNLIKKGDKYRKSNKLVPNLFDKKNYVIHYRNLKFISSLGVEIGEVHKILSFKQSAWLKPYIEFNTLKRKEAKNDFEKDFFKLMNNAVFGKTMENVKNRVDIHLTTDEKNAIKWFSKINFKNSKCIDGLRLIETYKKVIIYDKPIYVGTSILDLSKLCMMDFHYNVIHENFENKYNLIYSDTDSLVYTIQHDDVYEWMGANKEHFDLSDTRRLEIKDDTNKKVIGKFKDEMGGLIMKEFLGLIPKVYSSINQHVKEKKELIDQYNPETQKMGFTVKMNETYYENYNKKTLKGVSKIVVKKDITHQDYKNVLKTNKPIFKKITSIRSFNHQLYTFSQKKVALTSFYDKMIMIDSNTCVPYGYKNK
jgi:hypothetical protein